MVESKNNALHEAIERDDVEAVRSLLASGAGPNAVGRFGRTPLCSTSQKAVVALLLAHGADPNLPGLIEDAPLDVMVSSMTSDEVIEMLMKAGANPQRNGPMGFSTLPMPVSKVALRPSGH